MSSRSRHSRKAPHLPRSVAGILIVGMIALTLSPSRAEETGSQARHALESVADLLRSAVKFPERSTPRVKQGQLQSASEREAQVTRISLCPRRVLIYVGEEHRLAPLPLDNARQPVHGIVFSYETDNKQIASVTSDGTVTAVKSGECFVTAVVGQRRAAVKVEVREGPRPHLTNAQWDAEHANDCQDPERDPTMTSSRDLEIQSNRETPGARPMTPQILPAPDPDPQPDVDDAPSRKNAIGHPRFSPDMQLQASAASNDNQLGSSSFNLTIPIFGAGGRGVGVGLNLVYNSRVWTKDEATNRMVFDYDVAWPAPGFRLNYGRIIPNYNVASGSGDYLLIEADGTRTSLLFQTGSLYRSNDGRNIEFLSNNNRLFYPNGTLVRYELNGPNKLVPSSIRDIHGNSINISPVHNCGDALRIGTCDCNSGCSAPPKQAIKQITDTLGRYISFYYNTTGQPVEIRAPGYNSGPDRVIAKFYYETLTLSYNFQSPLTVAGVPTGDQVDVLKRVYFPETGRGYVFDSYSGYGMFAHASMRLGMTDTSQGTEIGYSEYTFLTGGALSDSPQISERREWWQGKTDDSGNDVTTPAVYTYSRISDTSIMTSTVSGPSGPNSVTTIMISDNSPSSDWYGLLKEERIEKNGVLLKQEFSYDLPSSQQGLQRNKVITTDDGSPANQTRTDLTYGQYGRLMTVREFGFPTSGVFNTRRRTEYAYLNTSPYISAALYRLVSNITVWDPNGTPNNDLDDVQVSRTGFEYDTPDTGWAIQKYGFTAGCQIPACAVPPGYDTSFVDATVRGLVTKALFWSDATGPADISFRHQYDIFGNEIKAEAGCCSLKSFEFREAPVTSPGTSAMFWSVPFSATDGPTAGPNLQNQYTYDFNTSFLKSQTDPNNLVTSYAPDGAMRLRTVTYPKLVTDTHANPTLETFYANTLNNESSTDTLVYQSRFTYFDGSTQKVQIANQWLDGAGRVVRQGSASGPTIGSFDAVKSIYDDLGRLRKSTNPYNTTNADGNTTGLPNATTYDYDGLNRVLTVATPDTYTVTTSYNGALTTVTDQVGRQRRSEVDGLGRTITVTEMRPNGQLNQHTVYGYDLNDNLTSVDQGGQTRAFRYDSLSRMTYERTPEQDATISDGASTWSAHYTYTGFNAIATREDARRVISTYSYDELNRLKGVAYMLPSPNPDNVQATATVDITYGSTVPKNGQVEEVKQSFSASDVPWRESYAYDGLSRLSGKTVSLDSQAYSYTTGYGYNQAGQFTQMTYPSQRVVKYGFDSRGRLNTVGDASLATKWVSSVGYQPSQQISSLGLGNGVTENFGYSTDRLQLTSQTATKSGNTLMSMSYNYVADKSRSGGVGTGQANTGQLMDVTGTIKDHLGNTLQRNESYNYDQVARLARAGGFYAQRDYIYDRFGNRTGVTGGQTQNVILQQPGGGVTNNRIATVNGVSYAYDAAGDVTSDGVHGHSYDAECRIVKVDNGSTAAYFYDSANRRVKKLAGGYTTYYVWEGTQVIAEYSNAPVTGGGTRFYHPDRLSNRVITDGSGVVKGAMDNLPFGDDGGVVGESEKHRFTTYERDSQTNSDYAINRQHHYATGRFLRPDPAAGNIADPQSLNRYAYVRNDAVNSTDPLGLLVCFVTYSYEYFQTTVDGEAVVSIRVIAHQTCLGWDWGGGGGQTGIGGDSGGIGRRFGGGGVSGGGGRRPQPPTKVPPVACPLDPKSLRVPTGRSPEAPWSRLSPPETLSPGGPQNLEPPPTNVPPPIREVRTPPNPKFYTRISPTDPMIPQDPSFGWKVKFFFEQALRGFGGVFKGAVRSAGEGFGFVMVNPCLIDRKYCSDPCREML